MVSILTGEEAWEKLQSQTNNSLLKKHLTRELFDKLKDKGSDFYKVISTGVLSPHAITGVRAADVNCYELYGELLDKIMKDYHGLGEGEIKHPAYGFGESVNFGELDPEGKIVISTRCRTGRSFKSLPLNANMTKENYLELEKMVIEATSTFEGELKGTYHSLATMDKEFQKQLIDEHYLFQAYQVDLDDSGAMKHWPHGRGIFLSDNRKFVIWCGEEDHLRVISMQKGANLGEVVSRLERSLKIISEKFEFAHSEKYGFLNACPTNCGTGIRCSVLGHFPKLAADMKAFQAFADENHIQIRGSKGVFTRSEGDIYDLSNSQRLGISEEEAIRRMYVGVSKMIEKEKSL